MVMAGLGGVLGIVQGLSRRPVPVSLFSLWLLCAAGISLLQCVPLPESLRGLLPIASDETLRRTLADLGGYPHEPMPLSLDPAETANEGVRLLGYLCALSGFASLRSRHGDSLRLAGIVVCAGVIVALLGALAALGIRLPIPLAVSTEGQSRALWPAVLQNANHMAALLSVSAILAVGMLLQTDRSARPHRFYCLIGSIGLLDAALLLSLSRAGVLCGLLGQLLTLLFADSPSRQIRRFRLIWVVFPSVLLFCASLLGPAHRLLARFFDLGHGLSPSESKVWLWQKAWPLLRGHWLTGIGRGSLETALQVPEAIATRTRFAYLENEWLQVLLDFGIPLGLLLVALLGVAMWQSTSHLWPRAGEQPVPVRRAALYALCCLGLHNLFDFNLATGAIALSAIALVTLVQKNNRTMSSRWLGFLGVVTLAASWWTHMKLPSHEEDGRRLAALAEDRDSQVPTLLAVAGQALRRHPLDSYLSAVVAARLVNEGHPDAMPWINRALGQNPADLLAKAAAAELLGRHGRTRQALALLGPMIGYADAEKRAYLFARLLELSQDGQTLVASLPPEESARRGLLEYLGTRPRPSWPLVLSVATQAVEKGDRSALPWLGRAALAEGQANAAETALRGLLDEPTIEPLLVGGLLEVLLRNHKPDAAKMFADAALRKQPAPEVRIAHAQVLAARGDIDGARQSISQALDDTSDILLRARIHEVRADLEQSVGQPHRAEVERQKALRLRREAGQP